MTIQLRKFDPRSMADDKVCIFIGKRGTGKTSLVTDILWHKKHLPAGIAMSGTEEGNGHYRQFIPDLFVYGEYNKSAIEKIIIYSNEFVSADDFLNSNNQMNFNGTITLLIAIAEETKKSILNY
jgi:hypothetical protein